MKRAKPIAPAARKPTTKSGKAPITDWCKPHSIVKTLQGKMPYAYWCAGEARRQTNLGRPAKVEFDGTFCAVVHA